MNIQLRKKGKEHPVERGASKTKVSSAPVGNKRSAGRRAEGTVSENPVLCREREYATLRERVLSFLHYDAGAVIYITGVPGSGKTHTVTRVLESIGREFVHVNCADLGQKALIFRGIGERMGCKTARNTLQSLRAHFHKCDEHHIVFIDEVDLLHTRTESLLYNLFEMPFIAGARLLLIVAANTLGTLSTKIESRVGKDRLEFRPYTSANLCTILKCRATEEDGRCLSKDGPSPIQAGGLVSRLRKSNACGAEAKTSDLNGSKSLELISKRIASSTGDIRRAFELADRTKAADLRGVDAAIRETAAPILNRFVAVLGYYQKLALYLNSDHSKNLIQWFHDFKAFCRIKDAPPLDFAEFKDCVDELVRIGVFSVSGTRVGSSYHKEELERAMKDDPVFCSFSAQ